MDTNPRTRVEILYFDGCPNRRRALERAREIVSSLGVAAAISEVEVKTLEDARRLGFLGSPSVRVDGIDIEPAARADRTYALACRTYDGAGVPSRELFVAALAAARSGHDAHPSARSHGWWRSLPTAAGMAALLLPVGACPACFPAYAAVLSALGVPFLLHERTLLPMVALLLAVAVASLAYRARERRGRGPFFLGATGSVLALAGKFALSSSFLLYGGLIVLLIAAAWNAWPRRLASSSSCAGCARHGAEVPEDRRPAACTNLTPSGARHHG